MNTILLVVCLLLAVVFGVAGVSKLADREGSRQTMTDFGVPAALAAPFALLLPLAELAVAAALVPAASAWWAALGALALLLVFVVGISVNLARGRKPECHCFGQLHSAPAGPKTLARNGALAAVAAFVVWQGRDDAGPSALGWIGELNTTQLIAVTLGLIALVLLAGQWWVLLHVLRQNGRLLVRVEALEARLGATDAAARSRNGAQQAAGLPVGSVAPRFSLSGLHGETLTLESLRSAGKPILLLFTDPDCGPCTAMLPEIGRWQDGHSEKLTVSLVSRGEVEENRAKAQEHGLTNVLLKEDWEVSKAYRVNGTPSAVLIEADGTIASAVMSGADNISALVDYVVGERAQLPMHHPQEAQEGQPCPNCGKIHAAAPTVPAAKKVGEDAPEVSLQDLEGNEVSLEDFRGEETLMLFWNPGCVFCQQMLPDLRELEQNPPEDAPKLLVVSAGTEEASREQGLSSTVVLDQNFAVGRAFGASGTPSAVLVDAEGKMASDIVVGAPAVLEMAGASRTGS